MGSVAIELDDEALARPEKVGDEGGDAYVHVWLGKAVATAESEEASLQFAAGVVGVQDGIEWKAQVLRLPERSSELRLGKEAAEVGQRSGWGRDRDAGSPRYPAGEEGRGPMDSDSGTTPSLSPNGDVHETPLGKELPERGGTGVAEDGIRPAGEHGRHPPSLLAKPLVPDGVNTAMKAVQALGLYAPQAPAFVDSGAFELGDRHHAVLVRRESSDCGVRFPFGEFPTHVGG